jgi:hypothetical protein
MRDVDRRLGGSPEHNTSPAFDELPPGHIATAYLKTTMEGTVTDISQAIQKLTVVIRLH